MLLAHRIALAPNNKQAAYFARASGVARFAYNWALAEWRCEYKAGGKPSGMMLRKRLNAIARPPQLAASLHLHATHRRAFARRRLVAPRIAKRKKDLRRHLMLLIRDVPGRVEVVLRIIPGVV
jgi:transposase